MGAGGARAGGYTRRNSRRRSAHGTMSDINVTPLVDVMLVLLIVFMVAAPLMATGIPLQLPKTKAKQLNLPSDPLTISVLADRKIYLLKTEVSLSELTIKLQALAKDGSDTAVIVRGDPAVAYGAVAEVLGELSSSGYSKINLQTVEPDKPGAGN